MQHNVFAPHPSITALDELVNHAGTLHDEGSYTQRRHGMPPQQRGLMRSYNSGRHHYQLTNLLTGLSI
ncbi:hypothetical protein [Streptomyces sp. NPDC053079]|uniref:hypothetical protein n=1 Tax=Streptomyces sp. NPDC053079 TaxID=3365697 RepID=UPI0037D5C580